MKKGTKIRNVFTDEMMSLIRNKKLSNAQVGAVIRDIIYPGEFEAEDIMTSMFAESFRKGYLEITLSCAESKLKELERLNKHYSKNKNKMPLWFGEYYANNSVYLNNVIKTINNVLLTLDNIIKSGNNVMETLANISEAIDNVPLTLNNTNTNTNTNTNDTDTIDTPKSPMGTEGQESEPSSALEDIDIKSVAERIENTYRHHSNPAKLRKCIRSLLKKHPAEDILSGYNRHLEAWMVDDFRWAPHKIVDWLYDRKFLDEVIPPKKTAAAEVGPQIAKFEVC